MKEFTQVIMSIYNQMPKIEQIIIAFWLVCFVLFSFYYLYSCVLLIQHMINKPKPSSF